MISKDIFVFMMGGVRLVVTSSLVFGKQCEGFNKFDLVSW